MCCMRRPDGPAAVSLGKDRNIAMMLRSVGIEMGVSTSGRGGGNRTHLQGVW